MAGLGLRLALGLSRHGNNPVSKGPLCNAIAQKVCVTALRKKKLVTLAPHVVYAQSGEQFAVAIEFAESKPNKLQLVTIPLAELSDIKVASLIPFTPDSGFDPNDPEFGNEIICVVKVA